MKGKEDYSSMAKELKGKAKWQNFWYYYKWAVFGVLFAVFLVSFTVYEIASKEHPDVVIDLITTGPVIDRQEPIDFTELYGDQIVDANENGEKLVSMFEMYVPETPRSEEDAAMLQKVDLEFVGQDCSLFLFDKANYDRFSTRDAFSPLDRFIDISGIPEEKIARNSAGEPIAVNLQGSQRLAELGFTNDELYACFLFTNAKTEGDPKRMAQFENAAMILEDFLK